MSENKNKPPTQESSSPNEISSSEEFQDGSNFSFNPEKLKDGRVSSSNTEGSSSSDASDEKDSYLGCLGGVVCLLLIFFFIVVIVRNNHMKTTIFNVLTLLGPLPVFYYARKNKRRYLFWGFVIPYLLLLLIFGSCIRY